MLKNTKGIITGSFMTYFFVVADITQSNYKQYYQNHILVAMFINKYYDNNILVSESL
jgi:hypothetical protein